MPKPTFTSFPPANLKDQIVRYHRLHDSGGTSDKEYIIYILKDSEGSYVVSSLYGRRGNASRAGNTTPYANQAEALMQYQSILDQKLDKGYSAIQTWYGKGTEINTQKPPATDPNITTKAIPVNF